MLLFIELSPVQATPGAESLDIGKVVESHPDLLLLSDVEEESVVSLIPSFRDLFPSGLSDCFSEPEPSVFSCKHSIHLSLAGINDIITS